MKKSKDFKVLKVIAMGALLSTGGIGAESSKEEQGADKENGGLHHVPSSPRERRKLTPEQQEKYSEYSAKFAQEIDYRRSVLGQPRLFDLNVESVDKVLNRLGNARVLGVRARVRVVNTSAEVESKVRQYIEKSHWGYNLTPIVAFNEEELMDDSHKVPVLEEAPVGSEQDEEGKDKKGGKKSKGAFSDSDDEGDDEFVPVKGKGFRLYNTNVIVQTDPSRRRAATRARYSPQFADLFSNPYSLRTIPQGTDRQPVRHVINDDQGFEHKGWGATSRPRVQIRENRVDLKNINLNANHPSQHLVNVYCRKRAGV